MAGKIGGRHESHHPITDRPRTRAPKPAKPPRAPRPPKAPKAAATRHAGATRTSSSSGTTGRHSTGASHISRGIYGDLLFGPYTPRAPRPARTAKPKHVVQPWEKHQGNHGVLPVSGRSSPTWRYHRPHPLTLTPPAPHRRPR